MPALAGPAHGPANLHRRGLHRRGGRARGPGLLGPAGAAPDGVGLPSWLAGPAGSAEGGGSGWAAAGRGGGVAAAGARAAGSSDGHLLLLHTLHMVGCKVRVGVASAALLRMEIGDRMQPAALPPCHRVVRVAAGRVGQSTECCFVRHAAVSGRRQPAPERRVAVDHPWVIGRAGTAGALGRRQQRPRSSPPAA